MKRVVIDIETRSSVSVKKVGPLVYADNPATTITHFGWRNGGPAHVWQPMREPAPTELLDALADERITLVAHNVGFERHLLSGPPGRALGLPTSLSALERWSCTQARAARLGLPLALENLCHALRLPVEKDAEGHRLMLRVSMPRNKTAPWVWWDDEIRMNRMSEYCARDVLAESILDQRLPELTESERELWLLTQRMNDRGILVDQELLEQLISLAEAARHDLNKQINAVTGGAVPRVTNTPALTRWLIAQGLDVDSSRKDIVEELLARDDLKPVVRQVLEWRQDGGGSSNLKTGSIARRLSADGRIRDALIYCGAASTGRWSSGGSQLQNLKRPDPRFHASSILRDLRLGATADELDQIHGPPLKLVSELLRPLFIAAPSKQLVVADYSQIEARVLAWASGQDDRLAVFRRYDAGGTDPYRITASRIYQACCLT
jgi:DNA polymerase bacteriophage-type